MFVRPAEGHATSGLYFRWLNSSATCDNIGSKRMRFHMPRFEGRGYGSFRSPARYRFFAAAGLRPMAAVVLLLALAGYASAQDENVHIQPREKPPADTSKEVKVNADLPPGVSRREPGIIRQVDYVLVNVTVTDDWNRIVTGLEKDNFAVLEGNQLQVVQNFSSEDAPISLGVIFDMSGSMSDKIEKAREAVVEFFKTANPQDEFFMITFSDRPHLVADFTRSIDD